MDAKIPQKIALIKHYQIAYTLISDYQVNISVCNTINYFKYATNGLHLNKINAKGLEQALNGRQQFSIEFQQIQSKQGQNQVNKQLRIIINFSSAFLTKITQQIVLPFKKKVAQLDFLQGKLSKFQQIIKQIQQKNNKERGFKSAKCIVQKKYQSNMAYNGEYDQYGGNGNQADYDIKQFQQIKLGEKGKYLIELSMLLNAKATYFYLYKDLNYTSPLPNGAMMNPVNNQFVAIKISFIKDTLSTGEKEQKLFAYDIADYPFEAKNIVITATKIQ